MTPSEISQLSEDITGEELIATNSTKTFIQVEKLEIKFWIMIAMEFSVFQAKAEHTKKNSVLNRRDSESPSSVIQQEHTFQSQKNISMPQ